jgi:hypothetical protein
MSRTGLTRLLGTALLLGFTAYQLATFGEFRRWFQPPLSRQTANIYWASNWRMFTHKARYHVALDFQGRSEDGDWTTLPMARWYPARWESGYRWDRRAVRRSRQIQEQFLHLACERSGMEQTRMVQQRWKKRRGRLEQPRRKVESKVLLTWTCGRRPRAPKGRVL